MSKMEFGSVPTTAVRFVRKMRGGTQAHLLETDDGNFYVVKFLENPQGKRILVNEWLASHILQHLGVTTPAVSLVQISAEFLKASPDVFIQLAHSKPRVSAGTHFGSRFPGHPDRVAVYDLFPSALLGKVANLSDFLGALAVDRWMANIDSRQAIFRLMINQGCRPEDLLSLRKEAVDLEHGVLRIMAGKSAAARRTLKLLPESRSILAGRLVSESPWVFPSSVKPGSHATKLNNAHARVLKDTGLRFVIYDFRHTAATRWAERGMSLATLAKILGHSNLRSVVKYVHPSQEHMDDAMLRFGAPEQIPAEMLQVGFRSVTGVKKDDLTGLSVNQPEAVAKLHPVENRGKIQ